MKKLAVLLMVALMAVSMIACSDNGGTSSAAGTSSVAGTPDSSAVTDDASTDATVGTSSVDESSAAQ